MTLNVRHPDATFTLRHEQEWPLARTRWTKLYLDPTTLALRPTPVTTSGTVEYAAMGAGVTFSLTLERETEITGPIAAKLFVSSSTRDADLFLIVRVFDPQGKELTFMGSTDPNTPIANGWLRASHRAARPAEEQTLAALPPTRSRRAADARRDLRVRRRDPADLASSCRPAGASPSRCAAGTTSTTVSCRTSPRASTTARRGTGGMTHADPDSRPPAIFDNHVTLHAGGKHAAWLMLPVV